MSKPQNLETRIKVGITHGDINGIGYEIIIKTLSNPSILELCTPIVYGSSKIASYYKKTLTIPDFTFNIVKNTRDVFSKRANLINCYDKEIKIDMGLSTEIAGTLSLLSLESAVDDIINNRIDVLVTAPIDKKNIQSLQFTFLGHTEYLAKKFNVNDYLMLMVSDRLRVGVVTGHIPLKNVATTITEELIFKKIQVLNNSLIKDFAINKPKIAVLGINPHASDNGLIGNEEQNSITPAIRRAFNKENILAFGPYSADGFFGSATFTKFDAVLAMYHDQGMLPFKLLAFNDGVNYTAGLPYIRTSPTHGVAYEIAGKNEASPNSFRNALYLAIDIFKNRQMYEKLTANPLKSRAFEVVEDEHSEQLEKN